MAKSTLRTVVVPTEHGGWGFTLEPALLGMIVAPGLPALGVAIATFAIFLSRRPLRIAVADWRRDRRLARTDVALWSIVGLGIIAIAGLALTWTMASDPFWWPLVVAAPLVAAQLSFDLDNRGRELVPELLGPIALGAAAPMAILAGGVGWRIAVGAWLVLLARIVPSILLVRAQLRRAKEQDFALTSTIATSTAALVVVAGAAAVGWAPWMSAGAAALLVLWNSNSMRLPPLPVKTLGWTQMLAGAIVVVAFAAGYHVGW